MIGKSIKQLDIRKRTGISIVGIVNSNNNINSNPDSSYRFKKGDRLAVMGNQEQLASFQNMCETNKDST